MKNMKRSPLAAIIIIFLVGILAGFATGWTARGQGRLLIDNKNMAASDVLESIKDKLREEGQLREEVSSLSGVVKEVNGDEVVFEVDLVNPLQDESLRTRTAVVNEGTEIVILSPKTKEEIMADKEEYERKRSSLNRQEANIASELKDCLAERGDCDEIMDRQADISRQINEVKELLSQYDHQEGGIEDIKPGFIITVQVGKEENIAQEKRLEAKFIQAGKEAEKFESGDMVPKE